MNDHPVAMLRLPCGHLARRERVKAALREGEDGRSIPVECLFDGCGRSWVLSRSRDGWNAAEATGARPATNVATGGRL